MCGACVSIPQSLNLSNLSWSVFFRLAFWGQSLEGKPFGSQLELPIVGVAPIFRSVSMVSSKSFKGKPRIESEDIKVCERDPNQNHGFSFVFSWSQPRGVPSMTQDPPGHRVAGPRAEVGLDLTDPAPKVPIRCEGRLSGHSEKAGAELVNPLNLSHGASVLVFEQILGFRQQARASALKRPGVGCLEMRFLLSACGFCPGTQALQQCPSKTGVPLCPMQFGNCHAPELGFNFCRSSPFRRLAFACFTPRPWARKTSAKYQYRTKKCPPARHLRPIAGLRRLGNTCPSGS